LTFFSIIQQPRRFRKNQTHQIYLFVKAIFLYGVGLSLLKNLSQKREMATR